MTPLFTRSICLLLALLVGGGYVVAQQNGADSPNQQAARASALKFERTHASFGDRYQRESVEYVYRFKNTSDTIVRVLETVVVHGVADLVADPTVLPPGTSGTLRVRQSLEDRLGSTAFRYALITDQSGGARHRVTLSGFVQSAYDPEVPLFDFGIVERKLGGDAEVELFSREVDRLRMLGVGKAPDFIEVSEPGRVGVAGEGMTALASLAPGAPEGYISGSFFLRTNVPHQPEILANWRALVIGAVVPAENPINLGLAEIGSETRKQLRFVSRDGKPFVLERLEADDALSLSHLPCADVDDPDAGLCRDVMILWKPAARERLGGALRVYVEGQSAPITVRYRGMSVEPGTEVRELTPAGVWGDGNP